MLVTFVWSLVLLHWHTSGWVEFASNILQCGMKIYSLNNGHCVNIVQIEQILGLVVIHPVFSHFDFAETLVQQFNKSFILINRTHSTLCHNKSVISLNRTHIQNAQLFVSSFSVSIISLIKNLSESKAKFMS